MFRRPLQQTSVTANRDKRSKSNSERFITSNHPLFQGQNQPEPLQNGLSGGSFLQINSIKPTQVAKDNGYNAEGRQQKKYIIKKVRSVSREQNKFGLEGTSPIQNKKSPSIKNNLRVNANQVKPKEPQLKENTQTQNIKANEVQQDQQNAKMTKKPEKGLSKTLHHIEEDHKEDENNVNPNNTTPISKPGKFQKAMQQNSNTGCLIQKKKEVLEFNVGSGNSTNTAQSPSIQAKFEAKMAQLQNNVQNKQLQAMKTAKTNELTSKELKKIERYFRFRLYSIFRICDDRIKSHMMIAKNNGKKKDKDSESLRADITYKKLHDEIWKQIKRQASTKSKYRYRDIINFDKKLKALAQQIILDKTPSQVKAQSLIDEVDDDRGAKSPEKPGKDTVPTDLYLKMKEAPNLKIFIIMGGYPDLKEALESRGWVENTCQTSSTFHLKWVLKRVDMNYDNLQTHQWVNHFDRGTSITTKAGLARNIRNLIWYENDDVDKFYARCYDVNDIQELEDFFEEFKVGMAISLLRLGANIRDIKLDTEHHNLSKFKICVAINICQRRLRPFEEIVEETFKGTGPLVIQDEWEAMNSKDWKSVNENPKMKKFIDKCETRHGIVFSEEYEEVPDTMITSIKATLQRMEESYPSTSLNQGKNIWIVKPAGLSRARGIACYSSVNDVIDHIKIRNVDWVIQKYIENPLIIKKRKFDIRQWVLVTDWSPLTVWFYDECYVRFTHKEYNPEEIHNRFAHLTNNSVSKHAEDFAASEIEGNMWTQDQLIKHFKDLTGKNYFKEIIQPRMKHIVCKSLQSVQDMVNSRKNSFELYGYDFMIDEDYNSWIIEVNCSPTMDKSTSVTKKLVEMVMEDCVKVVVDYGMAKKADRKNVDTGLFECICHQKPYY